MNSYPVIWSGKDHGGNEVDITRTEYPDVWDLVLVEQQPEPDDGPHCYLTKEDLRRLRTAIDAALAI